MSSPPVIHVHASVDASTVPYVTYMWSAMRALAARPEALRLSVHSMDPAAKDALADVPAARLYLVPVEAKLAGSMGHAACVEHALALADDGDVHVLADSDTVVLARGWDEHVRCELFDRHVGAIGATYEDVGGVTSGSGSIQTYKGAPNVVWMALSPLHRWSALRARPKKGTPLVIEDDRMSRVYGLPVGYSLVRDVAWQVPEYMAAHNVSYRGWKQLKSGTGATVLAGLDRYHEEYHVDGVPFVVHQRGSMKCPFRSLGMSNAFYSAVDAHLAQECTRAPRWRWEPGGANEDVSALAMNMKAESAERIARLEAQALAVPVPWIKVTLDGQCVLSRTPCPVPAVVQLDPAQRPTCLRIEGTGSDSKVKLAVVERPYLVAVRNATRGPLEVLSGGAESGPRVPAGSSWLIMVDVDGPVRVE